MISTATIAMWRQLNADHIRATVTCLDSSECDDLAMECDYHPIDNDTCLIIGDETAHLVRKSGLAIISIMEVNPDFLKGIK